MLHINCILYLFTLICTYKNVPQNITSTKFKKKIPSR